MKTLLSLILSVCSTLLFGQEFVDHEFEKGYVKDGNRYKTWEFYSENRELELKIDFSTGRLYYQRPDTSSFVIFDNGGWRPQRLKNYAAYALGTYNFYKSLREQIGYPKIALWSNASGRISVMFTVDSMGVARDFQLIEKMGFGADHAVLDAFRAIPNMWIPSVHEGRRVSTRFILPINFVSGRSRFPAPRYKQVARLLSPLVVQPPAADPYLITRREKLKKSDSYVVKEHENDLFEEYEVKPGTNIRNGSYLQYVTHDIIVGTVRTQFLRLEMRESGNFTEGMRTGIWHEFYASGTLGYSDYVSNQLMAAGEYLDNKKHGPWEVFHLTSLPSTIRFDAETETSSTDSLRFSMETDNLRTRAQGEYKSGDRAGLWIEFTHSGDTARVFDFDKRRLIMDREIPTSSYLSSPKPLYFGGTEYFSFDMMRNLEFRYVRPMLNKDSTFGVFLVPVDSNGNVGEIKMLQGNMHHLVVKEVVSSFKKCQEWIPATKDGRSIDGANVYGFKIIRRKIFERNYEATQYSMKTWLIYH